MLKFLCNTLLTTTIGFFLVWSGCSTESAPLSSGGEQQALSLAKQAGVPAVDVIPVYRVATGKNGERLTVFVFYEKGGKGGGKPPKDGGGESCSDPNTNQEYALLDVKWPQANIPVAYQPTFEPDAVVGAAFTAIDLGFGAWKQAVENPIVTFSFSEDALAPLPPERDSRNVVGWRQLVGRDARKVLAATYLWEHSDGTILEADIVYNTAHKWAVNGAIIDPTACGKDFDVQAIGTHEIGHFIGLGHVNNDDATMFGSAAKGELKKQTLTPGDADGAKQVLLAPPPS